MKELLTGKLYTRVDDITRIPADAIVNAANSTLLGGSGVDGAIHKAGGPSILEECRVLRSEQFPDGLPTGEAVETGAGSLPARFVIHTVGPVWNGGTQNEEELLYKAYSSSLLLTVKLDCRSVSFPAISTGAYGFPKAKAARICSRAMLDFFSRTGMTESTRKGRRKSALLKTDVILPVVYLVFFHSEDEALFIEEFLAVQGPTS